MIYKQWWPPCLQLLFKIAAHDIDILIDDILYFFSLQLSEMAADLAEEHSTATLATERLEAEQADRMKLEKDKGELEVSIYDP